MPNTSYNPKNVILTFAGQNVSGYAKGTFINFSFSADSFSKSMGSDGEGTLIASNDDSADLTVTSMHGSQSNNLFNRFLIQARNTGVAVAPLLLIEKGTNTIIASPQAFVKKCADVQYQDGEPPNKVWSLGMFNTTAVVEAGEELRPFLGTINTQ